MKRINLSIIIACLIFSINVTNAEVSEIKKGDIAAYDGFLFDKDTTIKMRNDLIDLDKYKALNDSYKKTLELTDFQIKLQKDQIELLLDSNKNLSSQLKVSNIERYVWFAAGFALMGTSVWLASRIK